MMDISPIQSLSTNYTIIQSRIWIGNKISITKLIIHFNWFQQLYWRIMFALLGINSMNGQPMIVRQIL